MRIGERKEIGGYMGFILIIAGFMLSNSIWNRYIANPDDDIYY